MMVSPNTDADYDSDYDPDSEDWSSLTAKSLITLR
jgi:hypothetical protein